MRRLRTWTTALLLGCALLISTGCNRTQGALLVGASIIGTALVLDHGNSHHNRRHHSGHYNHGYSHGGHGGYHGGYHHGGHGGGHYRGHYDYCD